MKILCKLSRKSRLRDSLPENLNHLLRSKVATFVSLFYIGTNIINVSIFSFLKHVKPIRMDYFIFALLFVIDWH